MRMICRVLDTFFESAIAGLRRLLQTIASKVVEPTVITAANAIVLDAAEFERRAAMGTMEIHKSRTRPLPSRNSDKIFRQQTSL